MSSVRLRQELLRFNPGAVRRTLEQTRLFFVLALGRSGTTFLADLLDRAEGCSVFHEARKDWKALTDAYLHPEQARDFLTGSRERLITARIQTKPCSVYGEVNSYLRYHVAALREVWNPAMLHVIRDGRAVVRSAMNRTTMTSADPSTMLITPKQGDPLAGEWDRMDRFARVCWYWAGTNRDLFESDLPLARFEDYTGSYDAFRAQVLEPLDLEVGADIWEERVAHPKNPSKSTSFPRHEDWSAEQKQQFARICGPVMERAGYSF